MKEKHSLTKIVLGAGPLNPHIKPKPFQTGGIFGCFTYVPFIGWVDRSFFLLLFMVGLVLAVFAPLLARR
jgi:hypothetical protein